MFRKRKRIASAEKIIAVICEYYDISEKEAFKNSRKRIYCEPRQMCMYFVSKYTYKSLKETGFVCGGKDHCNVLYSKRVIENGVETDQRIRLVVSEIEHTINLFAC
jgi:chromosomal replication initiation ATPase DnaA